MAIVTRAGKGSALTFEEVDGNFTQLETLAANAQTSANTANTALEDKQSTLVSGENIKTINGQSILGSGNITIEGGGSDAEAVTFNPVLIFDNNKYMEIAQSAAIAFSLGDGDHVLGKVISAKITGDGENAITFSEIFKILSGSVDNTKTNYLYFNYVSDTEIRTTISFEGGSVEAGIIGAPLLEGKIIVGDETNVSKAVTPSGDVNIDTNGVIKFGAEPTSLGNNQIPFRNSLGDLVGSEALQFSPETGFDVETDLAPVDTSGTEANYVANIFKSKIRSSSTGNSLTQKAWVFESDLESKADLQHLTGFHVKNKLDRKTFYGNFAHFFKVTNFEGGNDVNKFVVGNDGYGNEFAQFAGFLFRANGRMTVTGDLELYTNDGFSFMKSSYLGNRFQLPVVVGSTNSSNINSQFEVQNSNPLNPATAIDGGVLRHYRQTNTVASNATPVLVFELAIPNGNGYMLEVSLLANNGFNCSYFVFTTCVVTDNDGLMTFKGSDKNIIVEENDNVTWLVTTEIDDATKKFKIFFSKDTTGDVIVTSSVKTIKIG